ncbi:MAG: molybdate ABC transporter permease subunit [Chthoniobacterales bacterium]
MLRLSSGDWWTVGFSLWTAALATLLILPFGIAGGWLFARKNWPGKSFAETILTLPLVLPPVATGLILLQLLGRRGTLGRFIHDTLGTEIIFTWKAVVLAMAVMAFPLMLRGVRMAFESVNPRFEQVASTLGASDLRIFFTITLPLSFRGVIGGTVLGFARALGEFGATILVAGNIPHRTTTLSISIYNAIQLGHDNHAYKLLIVAGLLSFCALGISEYFTRRNAQ